MTSSPRYRTMSPAGAPVVDPPRASTGTMQLSPLNHNDPRDVPASRHAYTTSHPSDIYHASLHDPRVSRSPGVDVQTTSTNHRTPDHIVTNPRTEYTVPRQRSSTTSAADGRPLPLRLTVSPNGPSRHSPIISSAHVRSSSPWSADHERYLVPASPSHGHSGRRVYNYGYASDAGRPVRPRADRGEYHASTGRRRHHPAASRKPRDIDDYDAYSYTNPREQFEKDSVDHMGRRRGVYRRERPLSLTGAEDYYPAWAPKKESRTSGPPPSQRGFDKIDRVEDGRTRRPIVGGGESTGAGRSVWGQRDPLSLHDPFSLPPDWDDAYRSSPYRDEYYDDSHRHHSRRQQYPEDDSHRRSRRHEHTSSLPGPTGAEPGVLGLGSASLAAGYNDSSYNLSSTGDWADYSGHGHGTRRPRSRSRKPTRRRAGTDTDGHAPGVGDIHRYSRDPYGYHASNTKDQSPSYMTADDLRRGENLHSRSHVDDEYPRKDTSRQTSGGSSQDERRRSSESPAPPKDAGTQQTQQLKSILKQPKEKFPEEPNPVREGVAPLKDAHKKGIPPGARWTKVDRRLVNPEALKACNERFEERSDYVIVLRVLSKEEIQAYALVTQEIRDARYREYREQRRHKDGRRGGSSSGEDSYEDEEEEDKPKPREIEAPS